MLVRIYETLEDFKELVVAIGDIRVVMSEIKQKFGEELTNKLLYGNYIYVGETSTDWVPIEPDLLSGDLSSYKTLLAFPVVEGSEPISLTALIASSIGTLSGAMVGSSIGFISTLGVMMSTYAVGIATVLSTVIMAGISMGLNSLLAPDTSINSDPSRAQATKDSNLFNSSLIIREQGGSVPLIYGNPYCGGTLIYSSIRSEDVVK